jgi:hypothetical protein
MTSLRNLMIAAGTLLLSACASNGYAGGYGQYPNQAYYPNGYYNQGYYGNDPYYGNGGYGYVDDDNDSRWFRPERGVTCDRARDICYNQRGPSYEDSKQYFGKKDAKKAFNRLQEQDNDVLFSPRSGVTCDRSRGICYDKHGVDGDLSRRYFGNDEPNATRMLNSNGKSNNTGHDQDEWWLNQRHRATPLLHNDDSSQSVIPRPQHLADNDDNVRWTQPLSNQPMASRPARPDRPAAAAQILRPSVVDPPARASSAGGNGGSAGGSGGSATCLLNCSSK